MKILYLFILTIALLAIKGAAQQRLSLAQAIETGLKNRYDGKANAVSVDLARNNQHKITSVWLPEVILSGNARYNTQLPATVLPAGAFGSSETRRVAFGTKTNTVFSLDLTQPLILPNAGRDKQIADNNRRLELERLNGKNIDIRLSIAKAYYNGVLQTQLVALAQAAQQRFNSYYTVAKNKNQLGTLERSDFLQTELDYRNSILATQKAHHSFEGALIQLCYEINVDTDTALQLTDGIENTVNSDKEVNEISSDRTEIRQLRLQKEGFLLQAKKASWGTLPSVSFFANYSAQSQYNQISYFNQAWNNYNYLGLKLSLPVSDLLLRKTNIQTYTYNSTQTQLNQQFQENTVANEIKQDRVAYLNTRNDMQTASATLAVATEIAALLQKKFALGTTLYTQILDSEKSIQTAQTNYVTATYDYLIAKIAYQKALGQY